MTKVKVKGTGKAKGQPDVAIIQVEVNNENKDQLECRRVNNIGSEAAVAILKEVVEENDIYATPARVDKRQKSGIVGSRYYQGYNRITATIRNLEHVQSLVRKLNVVDDKLVQVSSLQFDIEDKEELENEARVAAFANAKKRAEVYGQQTNLGIKGIEEISEYLSFGSSGARHPSGKFSLSLRDSDNWIPVRGEDEVLEMGDIEVAVDATVCFILDAGNS